MSRYWCAVWGVILLGWAALPCAPAANGVYVIRSGDVVVITVFGEDQLTTDVRVPLSGEIEFPLIGSVKLVGRTGKDAIAEITERLGKGLVIDPKVMLTVTGRVKQTATIMGQVSRVGVIELPPENQLDVLTAIAMAGGFAEKADPSRVTVRRGAKLYRIDAKRMATNGVKGFVIEPRDVVIVGALVPRWITVMGEVAKPGRIALPQEGPLDLLAAIAMAGGYTDVANPKRVTVRRKTKKGEKLYTVNAKRLARDPNAAPFILLPDDLITVTESLF